MFNELQKNQDQGANNQQSTMPEGNNSNKEDEDDDDGKQKHRTNTRVTPGLRMNKTRRRFYARSQFCE
jgi:hypothetical protein